MNLHPVNCPQCQAAVPAGAAICPACDQILDESFLDGGEPQEEAPPPRPAVRRRPAGASRPTGAGRAATGMNRSMTGAVPSARGAPARPSYYDAAEDDGEQEAEHTDPGPAPRTTDKWNGPDDYVADDRPSAVDNEFEKSMEEIKEYVAGLEMGDKVAFGGALFTVLCTLLPWRNTFTSDGPDTEIGLLDIGTLSFFLAIATVVLLVVRTRSLLPKFNPIMVWSAQLGTTGANIFWCLLCLIHYAHQATGPTGFEDVAASGIKMVQDMRPSSPAYGLHFATLGGLVSLGGALLGLRSKPQ